MGNLGQSKERTQHRCYAIHTEGTATALGLAKQEVERKNARCSAVSSLARMRGRNPVEDDWPCLVGCGRAEKSSQGKMVDQGQVIHNVRLMAQSRHAQCADECPLLGAKRKWTNRCLPNSIYEYTA